MEAARLEDVWKFYSMGSVRVAALRGVNLKLPRGSLIALVGPSGSGKSTLIHLLAGLEVPDRGRVIVDGDEVSGMSRAERLRWRRRKVGVVFQFLHLIPVLTALENVILPMELAGVPRRERRSRALKLLEFVGLQGKADRLPSELSGGEQQRVAVARALAANPPLILADEPTANLDVASKTKIIELLRKAADNGRTVVFSTHDYGLASKADVIVRIVDGRIVGVEYT